MIKSKLTKVYKEALKNTIIINDSSKIIIFSDCHRGTYGWSDDFAHNANIYYYALNYYYNHGYTHIELGDGDELWENHNFSIIKNAYINIFRLFKKYHKKNRLYIIWGNHNRIFKNENFIKKNLYTYYNEKHDEYKDLLINLKTYEGIILKYKNNNIFLTHGHQGQMINDSIWWIGFFINRFIWKYLQIAGIKDPTSPAQNFNIRKHIEKKIKEWAVKNNQVIITGHTHRPVFPKSKEAPYFNTGSCVHPRCITGIEITGGKICLIKWFTNTKKGGTLFIDREEIKSPKLLDNYF